MSDDNPPARVKIRLAPGQQEDAAAIEQALASQVEGWRPGTPFFVVRRSLDARRRPVSYELHVEVGAERTAQSCHHLPCGLAAAEVLSWSSHRHPCSAEAGGHRCRSSALVARP